MFNLATLFSNQGYRLLIKINSDGNFFFGFSQWKQAFFTNLFSDKCYFFTIPDSNNNYFLRKLIKKRKFVKSIYVWSYNQPGWLETFCATYDIKYIRVEDGFIRSNSLGLDKTVPKSLIFDDSSYLYFDASRQSRFHELLRNIYLSDQQIIDSQRLIDILIKHNISKYNLSYGKTYNIPNNSILVLGQNEKDISLIKSEACFKDNRSLLDYVIKQYPNRQIVYKPHPDTQRNPGLKVSEVEDIRNLIIVDSLTYLFENLHKISEVHTISSLLGFEFLLRKVPVFTYSKTWYTGWGLTRDIYMSDDVHYNRSIYELFYVAYVTYTDYFDTSYQPSTIDTILYELLNDKKL